ncbi:MAG: nicotinate-nucleotide adenylyltransferase [Proteocatella sp.]
MKRIGILGGTFNPIHSMHIQMARKSKEILELDQVIFIPSANPPHKPGPEIEQFYHRIKMVELAIEGIEGFSVSNIENKINHKKSYTVDTLKALKLIYPEDKLFFIVGSDCVFEIENWNQPGEIFKHCEIVIFQRPDISNGEELQKKIKYLEKKYSAKISFVGAFTDNISSSEIRQKIASESVEIDELDKKILNYIKNNNLYKDSL